MKYSVGINKTLGLDNYTHENCSVRISVPSLLL